MLDNKTAAHAIEDIIEEPPAKEPFTTLTARLTKAYAITNSVKAKKLLNMTCLGDQTPSKCLTNMLMLVPRGQDPGFLFRQLFLWQLSSEIRTQLAQTTKIDTVSEVSFYDEKKRCQHCDWPQEHVFASF